MIYLFLADGFEEVEALTSVDVLRRAGLEVNMVSINDEFVTGAHNITVKADTTIEKIDKKNFDMIILPGGIPGADYLQANETLVEMIKYAMQNDKYIAAICAAPKILGANNILSGRKATCFPGYEKELIGASFDTSNTVIDGKIITSRAIGTAMDFALTLVKVLSGTEKAENLRKKMLV